MKEKCFYQSVVCNSKKPKFIKQQEASVASSLRIKTPLNKIPLLLPLLF